jgi:UDP-N-acetylmuramate--alanine ligase
VCEACEFVDTFLKLYPDISIILNIDEDHLDYFKTLDNIILSFKKFCDITSKTIIVNGDDENSVKATLGQQKEIITFGFTDKNDYYPANITKKDNLNTQYDLMHKGDFIATITLKVPGQHNIINSVAACVGALKVGATPEQLVLGLKDFVGAGRRFEVLGRKNGATIVDDYAHHPAEIKVTLEAAKQMNFNKIIAIFQPFTFSRTFNHLDEFAQTLSIADEVALTPIMGSREKNTYNIYSQDIAKKMNNCICVNDFEGARDYALANAKENDLVITLGCGDVYKVAKLILED